MKRFGLIMMVILGGLTVYAQTNAITPGSPVSATNGSPVAPVPPRPPTRIDSDSADFDLTGHLATYRGNVRVDDPQMKLSCAQLTTDLPESGGHPSRIVAETNVVIDSTDNKGQTNHVTGDKAVYIYSVQNGVTNETVTLTGNPQPQVENAQGTQAADVITWNRANNRFSFYANYHMVLRQGFGGAMGTNSPTQIKTTNFPPEAKENIDQNASNPPAADF